MTAEITEEPLISIIVPVYNVERFLRRCVKSLLAQTYRNIEIILIDDGSTDKCGEMCDQYAEKYSHVKVIHQKNGGLSAARNTGIDRAEGAFLYFADSDDYIASDSIEYLFEMIHSSKSDIAVASYRLVDESSTISSSTPSDRTSTTSMSAEYALIDALYEKASKFHAWGKLYRKDLFEQVRYPEGRLFEDVGTTYKLYMNSKSITISKAQKYFYTIRKGSITQSDFSPKMMDLIDFAEDIRHTVRDKRGYGDALAAADSYLFMSAVNTLETINRSHNTSEVASSAFRCMTIIHKLGWSVCRDVDAPKRVRLYAASSLFGQCLFMRALKLKNFLMNRKK